ncbi:hypothetical protein B0H12DRAFT_1111250 [Mycena haematopus]|nr:hypothetical protein B0H12DRAFT_1111250 [Mycena haematopus]
MEAEHSPLYRSIAEQVSAYIDIAVTEPFANWSPPYTALPMEGMYDYDDSFPLPIGLNSILGISEMSNAHRITMEQVLSDLLHLPKNGGVVVYIKEVRLAYRSRMNSQSMVWDIPGGATPFVFNYIVLARAEGALRRHRHNPHMGSNSILEQLAQIMDPNAGSEKQEKRLPAYIGGRVHARLVEAKARLDAVGIGHEICLAA